MDCRLRELLCCAVPCLLQVECLSDELFAHRHQSCESREKLRWTTWEKSRRQRRSSR